MKTSAIKIKLDSVDRFIVYIEYISGLPNAVITCNKDGMGLTHWDFDLHHMWGEFMYFKAGGGGNIKKIQAPQFVESGRCASVWIADIAGFDRKGKPKNCRVLKNPIRLRKKEFTTINPFAFSYQQVQEINYCKFCNGYYHEEGCPHHMNMWDGVYNDGSLIE